MSDLPGPAQLEAARRRIEGRVWRTPVFTSPALDEAAGANLFLKAESLQRTGSFKLRGATSAVRALPEGTRGVAAVSSGNHGQAVARAARDAGLEALIVMPEGSSPGKVAATRGYGAAVHQAGVSPANREQIGRAMAEERGLAFVHPFDDWDVIAGQASATLELLEDAPPLDAVVAPIGGGGLLSGAALACAAASPHTAVWGAEPAAGPDAHASLREGRRVRLDAAPATLADGVRTLQIGERPFAVLRERCAGIALVEEDELRAALQLTWARTKVLIEPTSALPLAALVAHRIRGRTIGVILSGGNVDAGRLASAL